MKNRDYKNKALELMSNGVHSQAEKKRILEALNKAYEQVESKIRTEYQGQGRVWDIPFNLHQFTAKKMEMFKESSFIGEVEELVVLRKEAKALDISKKVKEVTFFDEIKEKVKTNTKENEKVEVDALTKLLEKKGIKVHAIWHYVHLDNGTVFLRWFWYLNGSFTAYSDIVNEVKKVIEEDKVRKLK